MKKEDYYSYEYKNKGYSYPKVQVDNMLKELNPNNITEERRNLLMKIMSIHEDKKSERYPHEQNLIAYSFGKHY